MRRKRKYTDRIQPLHFQKSPLFKNPLFWIVMVIILIVGILAY